MYPSLKDTVSMIVLASFNPILYVSLSYLMIVNLLYPSSFPVLCHIRLATVS